MDLIPVSRPYISKEDIDSVVQSLEATYISGDTPPIRELEKHLSSLVGTEECVAVSSGTTALDLVVEAIEIKPKERCVVSNFTIISSISNLIRKQSKLVLIDSDSDTWSMDSAIAASELSEEVRLVLPVHIYGLPVDMKPIIETAKKFGVFILEDAAEALGLTYQDMKCGSMGDAGVFSFYANKIVTGGEGGAICTNDSKLADKLRSLRNLNFSPSERFVSYDLGWNHRLNGISATLINSQLLRLESLIVKKRELAQIYLDGLAGHPWLEFMPDSKYGSDNVYWVFPILLTPESPYDAQEFRSLLLGAGIDTRRFFCPMHLQPVLQGYDLELTSNMSISENLWNRGLYLPSGLGIKKQEVEKVIEVLWDFVRDSK